MARIRVGDAFIRGNADGSCWSVGTRAVAMTFQAGDGRFALVSFCQQFGHETREYIPRGRAVPPFTAGAADMDSWRYAGAVAEKIACGGQPAARLTLQFTAPGMGIRYRVVAFPGTSVLRQWVEIDNTGTAPVDAAGVLLAIPLRDEGAAPLTHYWMVGGNSRPDHGQLHSAPVLKGYRQVIEAQATSSFIPWLAVQRSGAPHDGWFLALEYLGNWRLSVARDPAGSVIISADVPDLADVRVQPGETLVLPTVTLGAFAGTLDDMGVAAYDWQYRYLWDYTNMDYYARPKWAVPWFYCAQNLQEQFAERLACLDMDAELMRSVGFEMLWDDAGWSVYDGLPADEYLCVFTSGYEGPDFRQTQRFLEKMGMRWLAWFTQRPSPGVMSAKVGAWGDFEWRSDAVSFPNWAADRDMRDKIVRFLDHHPGCSFHTCSGGSTYAHTFDIQRYANTNYFSDGGRGPLTNYYFSYLEPPDKWIDVVEAGNSKFSYRAATARQNLTMVPFWGFHASQDDLECLRRDLDTYRYLRREGVAGRWSYLFHPAVEGDEASYYAQRTSHDRAKACIIFKHQAPGPVTIYPCGLLPDQRYLVESDLTSESFVRTGADLMDEGIALSHPQPGDLIYLNLPHRPRSGRDRVAPGAPGAVLARRETNLGHAGVALYWSPASDDNWISAYEVRRGGTVLGMVCTGTMYFDRAEGWDTNARYAVRALDGDGNASAWTEAVRYAGEPLAFCALGGLFPEPGRQGWHAETTVDGVTFTPMRWVVPPKSASADEGGTPNQPGGVEGWWEGEGDARLGRAWMQASRETCCVRAWVAPISGAVRIVSRVMKEWYRQAAGAPLHARILHNGAQVWPSQGWCDAPLNDLTGAMHDLTLEVHAGDAIRFVLDRQAYSRGANLQISDRWTVFGPCDARDSTVPAVSLAGIPNTLLVDGKPLARQEVTADGGRLDLAPLLGGVDVIRTVYVFIPIQALRDDIYRLGIDVTGRQTARLDGRIVGSTMLAVNDTAVADRDRHLVNVAMTAGDHVLAFQCINNSAAFRLDVGLPSTEDGDIAAWMPSIAYLEREPDARAGSVVRLNCGAKRPYTDRLGHRWSTDGHYTGGCSVAGVPDTRGADDPALYRRGRQGRNFTYRIPVEMGLYTVRLRFTEPAYSRLYARPFHVEINGREVLRNFDICQDARGWRTAHDRVFRYIVPDARGQIVLRLSSGVEPGQATGKAIIQAIEILPEIKPSVRVNCGSDSGFIDWNSAVWAPDVGTSAAQVMRSSRRVAQASPTLYDQALYHTARCGRNISYALALPPGLYSVHLKFAELWLEEPGGRPMDIRVNGRVQWAGWDPLAAAGEPGMAIDLRVLNITPDATGTIIIDISAVGEHDAILQGIEVE